MTVFHSSVWDHPDPPTLEPNYSWSLQTGGTLHPPPPHWVAAGGNKRIQTVTRSPASKVLVAPCVHISHQPSGVRDVGLRLTANMASDWKVCVVGGKTNRSWRTFRMSVTWNRPDRPTGSLRKYLLPVSILITLSKNVVSHETSSCPKNLEGPFCRLQVSGSSSLQWAGCRYDRSNFYGWISVLWNKLLDKVLIFDPLNVQKSSLVVSLSSNCPGEYERLWVINSHTCGGTQVTRSNVQVINEWTVERKCFYLWVCCEQQVEVNTYTPHKRDVGNTGTVFHSVSVTPPLPADRTRIPLFLSTWYVHAPFVQFVWTLGYHVHTHAFGH